MKIAIITDTHMGARNNSEIFNDYFLRFFNNEFYPYLESNNIDTIIHMGDLSDNKKNVNNMILDSWNKNVFNRLRDYNCYFISGNHDIFYKHHNSITIQTSIELDKRFGVNLITSEPQTHTFDGVNLDFIPWISTGNKSLIEDFIEHTSSLCAFGHFAVNGAKISKTEECRESQLEKRYYDKYIKVYSGHFHIPSIINNVHYTGNPFEITWSDYNTDKGFCIFDTVTLSHQFIPAKEKMFIKLYVDTTTDLNKIDLSQYNNKHIIIVINENMKKRKIDSIVQDVEKLNYLSLSVKEIKEDIITTEPTSTPKLDYKNTFSYMKDYVNSVYEKNSLPLDKDLVLYTLRQIYDDAQKLKS